MRICGFADAIWKRKPFFDDLEIYEPVILDISKKRCEPGYVKEYDWCKCKCLKCEPEYMMIKFSNLKVFDFKEENRFIIINYLKNKGFKYHPTPHLKDRLIFEYKVCLFE